MTELDMPSLSRREARRRDRRNAIMEIALRSFLEKGYAATTMSEIAATVGGSKGTLWSYFPSKEDLFAAVLQHGMAAYHAGLMEILESPGELSPTLHRFATNLLLRVTTTESVCLQRLVLTEGCRFPKMGQIFFEIAPKHTRSLLADYLATVMEGGQLRKADPMLAARTLIMLTLSGCQEQILWGSLAERNDDEINQDADFAVDCFLRIYAPEP